MRNLDDVPIRRKFGLILAALLAVIGVGAAFGIGDLRTAQSLTDELAVATAQVRLWRELQLDVEALDGDTLEYLTTLDPHDRDQAVMRIAQLDGQLVLLAADYDAHHGDSALLDRVSAWVGGQIEPALATAERVENGAVDPVELQPFLAAATSNEVDTLKSDLSVHVDVDHAQGVRDALARRAAEQLQRDQLTWLVTLTVLALVGAALLLPTSRRLGRRLGRLQTATAMIGQGNFAVDVPVSGRDEVGQLGHSVAVMRDELGVASARERANQQRQEALLGLAMIMQSEGGSSGDEPEVIIQRLAAGLGVPAGSIFEVDRDDDALLHRRASVGVDESAVQSSATVGSGLIGQVARERQALFLDAPAGYLRIQSGLGQAEPAQLALVPVQATGRLFAVLEFASFTGFDPDQRQLLAESAEFLGLHYAIVWARRLTEQLLVESQNQGEELQLQAEELEVQANDLSAANSALEASTSQLEEQQAELAEKNDALAHTHAELLARTELVDRASAYKSAFLAKMSHELRTPLNSILILSERLAENDAANLTPRQVEFASTIRACGKDLLTLINEVLDLSKVESGRVDLHPDQVGLAGLCASLERQFRPIAEESGLELRFDLEDGVPETIQTDQLRVEQIVKNLLSNALKFTEEGSVELTVRPAGGSAREAGGAVLFEVTDSGIGIPTDQLELVFEPFAQVDNSLRRRSGGTGLGLAISRELARKLGGELSVVSEPGVGSTFRLLLPVSFMADRSEQVPGVPGTAASPSAPGGTTTTSGPASGTRMPNASLQPAGSSAAWPSLPATSGSSGSAVPAAEAAGVPRAEDGDGPLLLVVEDDAVFGELVAQDARGQGFRALTVGTGAAALAAVEVEAPAAITLDLGLPDIDGWVLLDRLRRHPATRSTPIQIISAASSAESALGVVGSITKPASSEQLRSTLAQLAARVTDHPRRLMLIGDDDHEASQLSELLADGSGLTVVPVRDVPTALTLADAAVPDGIVLDVGPAGSAREGLRELRAHPATAAVPIIVLSPVGASDRAARQELGELANAVIIRDTHARARLMDEVSRFLHRVRTDLSAEQRALVDPLYQRDPDLAGRVVLIVDDDPRNVFSLASILEQHDMVVLDAENGREALDVLTEHPEISAILMDIMMPEMDGLEATRQIRHMPGLGNLPIIMVTALASGTDRQKSLESGASDYLAKPVDSQQLISLLRVWINGRPN